MSTFEIFVGVVALYLVLGVGLLIKASRKHGAPLDIRDYLYAVFLWPFFLSDLLE